MQIRLGHGFDVHQLKENIPLIIGGLKIPYHKGSRGHSDGDALIHAIVDAIFGALSIGDLGKHFPSNDPKWKNANSIIFLEYANDLIYQHGYEISNIDSTIVLQEPVLKNHIIPMKKLLCKVLLLKSDQLSIKATTTDHLGFIGDCDGIASLATIVLIK